MQTAGTLKTTVVGASGSHAPGVFELDASVVLVWAKQLNLWIGRRHFVTDADGSIQRGQYLLITHADGGSLSRITRVAQAKPGDDSVQIEHQCVWNHNGLNIEPKTEWLSRSVLDGTDADALDGNASVRYIRPTSR